MAKRTVSSRPSLRESDQAIQRILQYREHARHAIEWQESQAEQRVRMFLAVATGSIAVLGLVMRLDAPAAVNVNDMVLPVLLVLLLYGLETLHSLNWMIIEKRQAATVDQFLMTELSALDRIAGRLQELQDEAYKLKEAKWHCRFRGSRQEFIYFANTLLSCGIVWNVTHDNLVSATCRYLMLGGTAAAVLALQYLYSKALRNTIPDRWNPGRSLPV